MTALHWAALRGYDEIVQLLLEYDADVDVKDWVGFFDYKNIHLLMICVSME